MSADDPFGDVTTLPKGAGLRIGIVVSRFNRSISGRLLTGARSALAECGVTEEGIEVLHVPGALEIPVVAKSMIESCGVDAVVALGCVIRGETDPLRGSSQRCGYRYCQGRRRHRCSRNKRHPDHGEPVAG